MANRFWRGGTGTWDSSTTTNWSTASGGAGGASAPTAADDVIIDALSGGGTITVASTAVCQSFDSTNAAACTMAFSTTGTLTVGSATGGKVVIGANVTITGNGTSGNGLQLVATSTNGGAGWPITTNGKTVPIPKFNGAGGRWQLQDNFTTASVVTTIAAGTLDVNGKTVTTAEVSVASTGGLLGGGVYILSSTTTAWSMNAAAAWTSSNEAITCSGAGTTFAGGGKAYNAVTLSGTGTQTITGNNTYGTLTRSGTGKTLILPASGNQVIVTNFVCTGAAGLLNVINSSVAATASTITNNSGAPINCDFLSLQDSTVAGKAMGGGHNTTYGTNVNNWVHGVANASNQTAGLTSAGSVARKVAYPQSSALTSSAAIVRAPIAIARGLLGTLTSAASIPWTVARGFAGVGTSSGVESQSTSRLLAGGLPPAGVMTRALSAARSLSGALTSSGSFQRALSLGRQLAGVLTSSGDLPWLFSRVLSQPGYSGSLLSGLVGYWRFEDGSGSTAADTSGNGNTATWQGTLGSQWGAGKLGGGGVLDGSTNYLSTPITWSKPCSMAAWINISSPLLEAVIFGGPGGTGPLIFGVGTSHQLQLGVGGTDGYTGTDITGNVVPFGVWTHVGLSYDASGNYVSYVNGVAVPGGSGTRNRALGLAVRLTSWGFGFPDGNVQGTVDEMGLWNRVLSASEFQAAYLNGPPSLTSSGALATGHINVRTVSGALTFVGTLPWSAARSLAGVLTSSGKTLWSAGRTLTGSEAPTGGHTTAATRLLAAALTSSGNLAHALALGRLLTAALMSSGSLVKLAGKPLVAANLTPAGALQRALALGRRLAGALTSSGAISKATGNALAATLTSAGALPWSIARKLAAAATSSGTISTNHSFVQALAGAVTSAGSLPWNVARGLAGAVTSSGTVSRINSRIVKGAQFLSGLLPWQTGKNLAASEPPAGSLGSSHAGFRVLTGALTSIGGFTHIIPFLRTVSGVLSFAGDMHPARGFSLAGALSASGFLTRNMHLARTLSSALGLKTFWRWLGKAPAVTTTLNVRRVSYVIEPDPGAHTVVITTPSGALEVYDWPQSPAILRRGFVQRRGSDAYICTFATEESYDDGPYLGSISAEGMVRQDFQVTVDSDAEIDLLP